ncbi:GNAT family N-acetyltransferase [Thiomicrorhabdus sp.]|uniref:GNAT family N-acetyltransferase n=1 Tax=Thiomicrorhabdus sp. TaxID=2039724 RepID=UPI0029C6E30E|nr:GNAT family N-acetyltransferase [Thiomicrorhabdus sp.]
MPLDKENLHNLTGLWKKYGVCEKSQTPDGIQINRDWPHRVWMEQTDNGFAAFDSTSDFSSSLQSALHEVPMGTVFPLWIPNPILGDFKAVVPSYGLDSEKLKQLLQQSGWHKTFEQTAMYLNLDKLNPENNAAKRDEKDLDDLHLIAVTSQEDLSHWIKIASEAFQYDVNSESLIPLLDDSDIRILLGQFQGSPVACALLYKTGSIIGLHQMGVRKDYQGKGIARRFMYKLMQLSAEWSGKTMVLQASNAGLPLYEKLGFSEQFFIENYQKTTSNNG